MPLHQPRERLLRNGAAGLSDADLLAVMLGTGMREERALQMAQRILSSFDHSLQGLLAAPVERLLAVRGLGVARVARLKALQELVLRDWESVLCQAPALNDAQTVTRYVRQRIGYREREVFACLFLDARHCLLRFEELFLGSVNRAHVHAREVLKRSMELNAAALVLAHNHPSGVAEPSSADLQLTVELKDMLARVDIQVLDHIIVARHASVSLASRGLL